MVKALEIKVGESEFKGFIDREKAVADVKRAYPKQLELLHDAVNYGSNLIPRSFTSSDKTLKDLVVIGTLLRQVVVMLDGVELLASSSAIYAAGLQARALFEASIDIDWILSGNAEEKATYYYVHNIRKQRMWAQRLQPASSEAAAFASVAGDLETLRDQKVIESAKNTIANIDQHLAKPRFAAANAAFEHLRRKTSDVDCAWHVPLGKRSFRSLAKAVNRDSAYLVFYAHWSEVMHSSNYRQHLTIGDGTVTFEPFRILKGFRVLYMFTLATAFRTYRTILEHYRPGELPNFKRKYLENWQKPFMNMPEIKFE
jgi:hypothetical protein